VIVYVCPVATVNDAFNVYAPPPPPPPFPPTEEPPPAPPPPQTSTFIDVTPAGTVQGLLGFVTTTCPRLFWTKTDKIAKIIVANENDFLILLNRGETNNRFVLAIPDNNERASLGPLDADDADEVFILVVLNKFSECGRCVEMRILLILF
jgi:hypothetical protein